MYPDNPDASTVYGIKFYSISAGLYLKRRAITLLIISMPVYYQTILCVNRSKSGR